MGTPRPKLMIFVLFMRKHPLVSLSCLLLFAACLAFSACRRGSEEKSALQFGSERYDSAALHLALITNRASFPIVYAKRTGIYDSLRLKLQLIIYHSQTDCDTALLGRFADGGMADPVRLATHGRRAAELQTLWQEEVARALFVNGTLRVKDVKNLKGRTVAVSPRSGDDNFLTQSLETAGLKANSVYRPQIASLSLRAEMLAGNQVDAAVLTWPYAAQAQASGQRCIYEQKTGGGKATFVMKAALMRNAAKAAQYELLEKGRRMAIDSLRTPSGRKKAAQILMQDYAVQPEVADTLRLPY